MSFLEAYKRLDNVCRGMFESDRGVTAYIEYMEECTDPRFQISGWRQVYFALKHYRWVRNQIVHEPGVTEETMCTAG